MQKGSALLPGNNLSLPQDFSALTGVLAPSLRLSSPAPLQTDYAGMARALDAIPDAAMVRVAGPAVSVGRLGNKIAEATGANTLAVIYPDIGEPYRSVFAQIVSGIDDKSRGRVSHFAVGANADVGELNNTLRRQDTRVVIALGKQGAKVASALDSNIRVVVGGVLMGQENKARNLQVNVLSPDPALLFRRLKDLMPGVSRIFAVYDPRQNTWMMRLAREAARAQGLEFAAFEAQNLRSATNAYRKILGDANSSRDALWLPQDSTTVEEGTILPMVLQASWDRNLAVFSSSFGHVKRGALFSLYPDNVELGRQLAGYALGLQAGNEPPGMLPLRAVLMAVNLRMARHLDANISRPQNFDMTFPAP
ncbi:MAG: hypothetical protein CO070_09915 [Gallionellales bacterium CG_4_9_14_0_8_um_filter_55_61]|nr:MAG: hypothetical protein CO070_09915 [Gallionellales bacterium CG_4_9_14_0_8_um_filter_55_61]